MLSEPIHAPHTKETTQPQTPNHQASPIITPIIPVIPTSSLPSQSVPVTLCPVTLDPQLATSPSHHLATSRPSATHTLCRWLTFYLPILVILGFVVYILAELFMKHLALRTVQHQLAALPDLPMLPPAASRQSNPTPAPAPARPPTTFTATSWRASLPPAPPVLQTRTKVHTSDLMSNSARGGFYLGADDEY